MNDYTEIVIGVIAADLVIAGVLFIGGWLH